MVAVAVPISIGRSELIAMALMPATQLSRSLTVRPLPQGWDVRLVDSAGQVIAPSGKPPSAEPGWAEQPRRLEQNLAHAP